MKWNEKRNEEDIFVKGLWWEFPISISGDDKLSRMEISWVILKKAVWVLFPFISEHLGK